VIELKVENGKNFKLKKKIRPSSSLSPSQINKSGKVKEKFNMTSINFNQSLNLEPRSKDSSKKVIALKNFKFSKKQQSQSQNPQASLPKPPLHKKNFNNESTTETFGNGSTAEALLKMADERLATIEQELSQTRSASKKSV